VEDRDMCSSNIILAPPYAEEWLDCRDPNLTAITAFKGSRDSSDIACSLKNTCILGSRLLQGQYVYMRFVEKNNDGISAVPFVESTYIILDNIMCDTGLRARGARATMCIDAGSYSNIRQCNSMQGKDIKRQGFMYRITRYRCCQCQRSDLSQAQRGKSVLHYGWRIGVKMSAYRVNKFIPGLLAVAVHMVSIQVKPVIE